MGKYSEYDRASMSLAWRVALWIIGVLVFVGLLGWLVLGIRAATSETKGQLDKTIQINKGTNQIQSQELFEDLFRKVKEYDQGIDVLAAAVRRDPSAFNQTNLDGQVLSCIAAAEQYNAETRKVSRSKWISPDLPYEIDRNDPKTDCQETKK